jgi:uncharacterized protein (TIGR00369 family)
MLSMKPRNAAYEEAVAAMFRAAPFVADLGIEVVSVAVGRIESRLAVTRRHLQHDGLVHAAVLTAIADHTAGAAAFSVIEADQLALSVNLSINLLRPGTGEELRCQATILRAGRRVIVAEAEVFARGSALPEVMVTKATVTLAVLRRTELSP